jgi:hypothetical protein
MMTLEIAQRAGMGLFLVSCTQVASGCCSMAVSAEFLASILKRVALVGQGSLTSIFAAAADFPA